MTENPVRPDNASNFSPTTYVLSERLRPLNSVVVFTGHAPDGPSRPEPRFPSAAVTQAQLSIEQAFDSLKFRPDAVIMGGTAGADLLAAQAAVGRDISVRLVLPFDRKSFRETVVGSAPNPNMWLEIWDRVSALPTTEIVEPVLTNNLDEGATATNLDTSDSSIYENVNQTMVNMLKSVAGDKAVIAYWNGKGGDKPGGTEDAVKRSRDAGATVTILQEGLENVDPSKVSQYSTRV